MSNNAKKNIFGIITSSNNYDQAYNLNKEIYDEIYKKFGNFYILDLSNYKLFGRSKSFKKKKIPSYIKVFKPKNSNEFFAFFKNKTFIAFNNIGKTLSFFRIYYLLNRINLKQILLMNIGYPENKTILQNNNYNKKAYFYNLIFYLRKKISYVLFRLLTIFNIFPKIDIYFECSRNIIKHLENVPSKKFENIFPFLKLAYFRKIYNINCRAYSNQPKFKNKYICFIDSHFEHQDRILREGKIDFYVKKKYYDYLNNLLICLRKILKKQVIVCIHPKNNDRYFKKRLKKFRILKFKTNQIIRDSFVVLFHESSSIIDAVVYNKKIISLDSFLLGQYLQNRVKSYRKLFNIKSLNLENQYLFKKSSLLEELNFNKKEIKKYIKNSLISDNNKLGKHKVIEIIKKELLNEK